jgi:hypothetical protein
MTKQSIIASLKQILREADDTPCGNWANANLAVRAQAPAPSANDPSYRSDRPKSGRLNAKKSAIAA